LWEESLDPGLVDEVEGSCEGGEEEEVEEDARYKLIWGSNKLGDNAKAVHERPRRTYI
jgi:hypothetical protein